MDLPGTLPVLVTFTLKVAVASVASPSFVTLMVGWPSSSCVNVV